MTKPFDSEYPFFQPVEDYLLGFLKPLEVEIPGLKVGTWIENEESYSVPFMLVRAGDGSWTSASFSGNDNRFTRRFVANIQVFTREPNADQKGALLSEIAYQRLQKAVRKQTVIPGVGHLTLCRINSPYTRSSNWATSTGINQYASLSKNDCRYEGEYGVIARPDLTNQMDESAILSILNS